MKITKEDIGRRVFNNYIYELGVIEDFDDRPNIICPVKVKFDIGESNFYFENTLTLEFIDEPKSKELQIEYLWSGSVSEQLKNIHCLHPKDQVINNSANGEHFKYCRKCKMEVL